MKITPRRVLATTLGLGLTAWLGLLAVWYCLEEGPNYSRIEPGLYLGGRVARPPRGTRAVLNLCQQEDEYEVAESLWRPIKDAPPAPSLAWLREAVGFIETNRAAGRTTYVHCRNGVSRSGLVVVAYVMKQKGWGRDEAMAFVRQRRPGLRPNPVFRELLLEWEREVKRPGEATSPGR